MDAFGVRAVDYVLKPFDRQRLETALERAAEYVNARRAGDLSARIEGALAGITAPRPPEARASGREGRRAVRLPQV